MLSRVGFSCIPHQAAIRCIGVTFRQVLTLSGHGSGTNRPIGTVPCAISWVGHLGLLPVPPAAFGSCGATFDSRPSPIPGDISDRGWQIGHHQAGVAIANLPARQPGARQLTRFGDTAGDPPAPGMPNRRHGLRQRAKARPASGTILAALLDAQQGMPPSALAVAIQPAGIEPAIG
jgi:hypothetical protein